MPKTFTPRRFIRRTRAAHAAPSAQRLRDVLRRGLEQLDRREGEPGIVSGDLQLVVQVCAAEPYGAWRDARAAAWLRQGGRWSTEHWPDRIAADAYAGLLVAVPADELALTDAALSAVDLAPLTEPVLAMATDRDLLVLGLLAGWVGNPAPGITARLAPPIVEAYLAHRVVERSVERFGQSWPLPATDRG